MSLAAFGVAGAAEKSDFPMRNMPLGMQMRLRLRKPGARDRAPEQACLPWHEVDLNQAGMVLFAIQAIKKL